MSHKYQKSLIHVVLALVFAGASWAAHAGTLRAGAARVDITPTPDEFPYTAVGARTIAPYIGVHDPVFARAIFLDDGSTQVAIVVVDVTAIPSPKSFLPAVAKEAELPEGNVFIAASHTHSVPLVNYHVDYPYQVGIASPQDLHEIDRLTQGAAEAAREAKANMQPARIGFNRGEAFLNLNNERPDGPSDKSLDVLRVDATDGTPIALLVDYGVPSGLVSNNYKTDGGILVSGDLFGVAAQLLESQSPKAPIVLFASGSDGDQRAILSAATLPKVGTVLSKDSGDGQWTILDMMARTLANATLSVMKAMPEGTAEVTISATSKILVCPGGRYRLDDKTKEIRVEDKPPVPIPLNLIRINDIALAGVGGNLESVMGRKIKAASPFPQTTVIGGTVGSIGYIPTDASYVGAYSHEVFGSPIKAGCAEAGILQEIGEMMKAARH